jgi:acid phosphatase family membrane protein YuiD
VSIPYFIIPILCGLIAQFLKPLLNKKYYDHLSARGRNLPRYGGMPSAHAAFALSLTTVVGLADGVFSTSFALASAAAIFVLDDALRMRIFLGRYGGALRKLINQFPPQEQKKFPYIESRLGHTVPEVIAGSLLGLTISVFFFWMLTIYF